MKNEILNRRKSIYDNLKKRAMAFEDRGPDIVDYLSDQTKTAQCNFQLSSLDELKNSILHSDFIFIGDFHTFDQNMRNVLRVIKVLQENNSPFVLALEMVHHKKQVCVEAYLEGHLTEFEFLDSIEYNKSWRFPWTHYRELFHLARNQNIEIIAVNTDGGLRKRDQFCAEHLHKHRDKLDNVKCVVLYGELHIVKNKIPKQVNEKFPDKKQIIIHQNLDEIYWKTSEQITEAPIFKFKDNEYCILTSPPWIKYESMLYWYENLYNDPDFDLHEYIIETGKKFFSEDTHENFNGIILEMKKIVNLSLSDDKLLDYNLYDHTNIDYIEDEIENLHDDLIPFYWEMLKNGESFKLPSQSKFYCSNYSINRISYLAGAHIFYQYQGLSLKEEESFRLTTDSFFIQSISESCFSYFFSKIINPHRKCDLYIDIKSQQQLRQNQQVLNFLNLEFDFLRLNQFSPLQRKKMANKIGHLLGEYLYMKAYKDIIKTTELENLLRLDFSHEGLRTLINIILSDTDFKNHQKRFF